MASHEGKAGNTPMSKFIQFQVIATEASPEVIYALDIDGRIWRRDLYHAAELGRMPPKNTQFDYKPEDDWHEIAGLQ